MDTRSCELGATLASSSGSPVVSFNMPLSVSPVSLDICRL
jgi:hypothetical protein